jgi:hypothetical protein
MNADKFGTWPKAPPAWLLRHEDLNAMTGDAMPSSKHSEYPGRVPKTIALWITSVRCSLFQQANQSNLALLFSLRHDFPTEWSAFANAKDNSPFTAFIRRDYFPYFVQGKMLTLAGLELYAKDVSKHQTVAGFDLDAATTALNDPAQARFTFAAGPTQVLTRAANAEVFLIVRYTLGT